MKSQKGNIKPLRAQVNGRYAVDQTGDTIDLSGYDSILFVTNFGNGSDTYSASDKVEQYLQESDDGTTWTDVLAEHVQGAIASQSHTSTYAVIDEDDTDEEQIFHAHYVGHKPYVRTMTDYIGTHAGGIPVGSIAIARAEKYLPIA